MLDGSQTGSLFSESAYVPSRKCNTCKQVKTASEFYRNPNGPNGLYSRCKKCHGIATRKWSREHKELIKRTKKIWKEKNRDKVLSQNRASYRRNIEKRRSRNKSIQLKSYYGITLEDKEAMLAAQGGCGCCGTKEPGSKKGWHVDHCHSTNKVRGILCHHCNAALGNSQESIPRLEKMIAYLKRFQK